MKIAFVGAPCSGKSTASAYLNYLLTLNGHRTKLVQEYAKDHIANGGQYMTKDDQLYIYRGQLSRECPDTDGYDFVVCDTALWVNHIYWSEAKGECTYEAAVIQQHLQTIKRYDKIVFLKLDDAYTGDTGRVHNQSEALHVEKLIEKFMIKHAISHVTFTGLKTRTQDLENFMATLV